MFDATIITKGGPDLYNTIYLTLTIDLHYISIDTENTSVNLTLNTVTEDRVIPILIFNDNCYKGKHTYYSDSVKTTDVNPTNDKPGSVRVGREGPFRVG